MTVEVGTMRWPIPAIFLNKFVKIENSLDGTFWSKGLSAQAMCSVDLTFMTTLMLLNSLHVDGQKVSRNLVRNIFAHSTL